MRLTSLLGGRLIMTEKKLNGLSFQGDDTSLKYKMSVTLTFTTKEFQSLVENHSAALVELGLLPTIMDKAQPQPQPQPQAQPQVPDYTEFIDLMIGIFDGPPEDLEQLREHITSALKGKKVENKWNLEFQAATPVVIPQTEAVVDAPVSITVPQTGPVLALPESPYAVTNISRKTLSLRLDCLRAGRAAKKARLGYRLAPSSDCAKVVSEIDAGERVSPTPSVSWKKGQAHHPKFSIIDGRVVIAVMANGGDMSEKQITMKSGLKPSRVRDILRELERQGIAIPF